jgi:hypothetical protein
LQVGFVTCFSDSPEGKNVGATTQKQSGAYHTLSQLFWTAGAADDSALPPPVAAALAGFVVPWAPESARRADDVLVMVGTEEVHTRWVGTVPADRAEAAWRAADEAVLNFAASVAVDPRRTEADVLAAASVTVALRRDPVSGRRGGAVCSEASAATPVCLRISQGGGRMVRFLLVVPPGLRGASAEALAAAFPDRADVRAAVAARAVRAVDSNSAANAVVAGDLGALWEAPREAFTHAEVHASLRNSLRIMSMVRADNNPPNRVATGASQHGQKPSFCAWPTPHLPHNPCYVLLSGSKKFLKTRADKEMRAEELAVGQGQRVAIAPWTGDTREDCCELNGAAAAAGFLSSLAIRAAHAEPAIVMRAHAEVEQAEEWDDKPVKTHLPEGCRLQADGTVSVGARVPPAGGRATRVVAYPASSGGRHPNASMEDARVHAVLASVGAAGDRSTVTTVTAQTRFPEDGDKTSNNHACKAVFKVLPAWLCACMPDGSQPVATWNPQTLSQRCVYGFLLEVLQSALLCASTAHLPEALKDQVAALRVEVQNGAAFEGDKGPATVALANALGWGRAAGRADLVDPRDGSRTTCRAGPRPAGSRYTDSMVAVGFLHASLLRQFATEKHSWRGSGPGLAYNVLTDQPTAGKAKMGGGTRGEMEYDALVAHGVMLCLWQGDGLASDGAVCLVCPGCGYLAASEEPCSRCASRGQPDQVPVYTQLSSSFRLLQFILRGIGVDILLRLAPE